MKIIEPVIQRPLGGMGGGQGEDRGAAGKGAGEQVARAREPSAHKKRRSLYRGFLDRLRAFRVLDPACGSGNFLYLALQTLKDLEQRASIEAEALGLPRVPAGRPEQLLGIEINPYAAELAQVRSGSATSNGCSATASASPRTRSCPLENIECRDAILNPDGTEAEWPRRTRSSGIRRFLGGKLLIERAWARIMSTRCSCL